MSYFKQKCILGNCISQYCLDIEHFGEMKTITTTITKVLTQQTTWTRHQV